MRANVWSGRNTVQVEEVPDPKILNDRDAIVKISSTAICGSDLHLYDGYIPTMEKGDILGHEFMGEVVEVGRGVSNLRVGDRVVVPFPIACGHCFSCEQQLFSVCDYEHTSRQSGKLRQPTSNLPRCRGARSHGVDGRRPAGYRAERSAMGRTRASESRERS